jgi:hypothetical protein
VYVFKIFDDPVKVRTKPKIDSFNQNYRKNEAGVKVGHLNFLLFS